MVKKNWPVLAAIAFLVLSIIYVGKSCRLDVDLEVLKQMYEKLRVEKEALEEQSLETIAGREEMIARLSEEIEEHKGHLDSLYLVMSRKDEAIGELEKKEVALSLDEGKKDELIVNLRAQINGWKEKFSLAEKVVGEKDKIIFALTEKYEAQVKISFEYKELYTREKQLHSLALERVRVCEKKVKKNELLSRVKSVAIVAVGGILVYSLIQKQ